MYIVSRYSPGVSLHSIQSVIHFVALGGGGAGAVVKAVMLGKSEIAGSSPSLAFQFERNKVFLPCSLVRIQYCGEPLYEYHVVINVI